MLDDTNRLHSAVGDFDNDGRADISNVYNQVVGIGGGDSRTDWYRGFWRSTGTSFEEIHPDLFLGQESLEPPTFSDFGLIDLDGMGDDYAYNRVTMTGNAQTQRTVTTYKLDVTDSDLSPEPAAIVMGTNVPGIEGVLARGDFDADGDTDLLTEAGKIGRASCRARV